MPWYEWVLKSVAFLLVLFTSVANLMLALDDGDSKRRSVGDRFGQLVIACLFGYAASIIFLSIGGAR